MKRLILMRHAEAGWHINIDDHERPLTTSGIRDAKKIGFAREFIRYFCI